MGLFSGKIGLVMGVANDRSIAWAMSEALYAEGAELAFTHLPQPSGERRVKQLVEPHAAKVVMPCDVQKDADIAAVFEAVRQTYGKLDFLIHSIAFAPPEELRKPYLQTSRAGWHLAMDISAYSLVACCREAAPLMSDERHGGDHQLLRRRESHAGLQPDGRLQGGLGAHRPLPGLGPGPLEQGPADQLYFRRSDADAQFRRHLRFRRNARARRQEILSWAKRGVPGTGHDGPLSPRPSFRRPDRRDAPRRLRLQHYRAVSLLRVG